MAKRNKNRGLTEEQVIASRREHGNNVLTPPARESLWKQFLRKFDDPLIRILLVALALSVGLSIYEYFRLHAGIKVMFEPVGIFLAIILATLVGFLVEVNANKKKIVFYFVGSFFCRNFANSVYECKLAF